MKFLLTFFATVLTFNCSLGQEKTKQELFKPFTLIIINPDSARIPDSLRLYADSIVQKQKRRHLIAIRNMEKLKEWGNEESKPKMELQIQEMKSRENEANGFKYYHTVANKTLFELGTLFNTNYWEKNYTTRVDILKGNIIDPSNLVTRDLDALRRHYKVDYIITFENVHVDSKNGTLTLKYTVTLFSRKEEKVILKKEIEGNAPVDNFKPLGEIFPPGNIPEFGVHCDNYLECAFKSAVRFSTEELFKAIETRQKK